MESRLVLQAAGIGVEATYLDGQWQLRVAGAQAQAALQELAEYRQDAVAEEVAVATDMPRRGGAFEGVFVYIATVVLLSNMAWSPESGEFWMDQGHMRAGDVLAGQWWRCITALTLHVDGLHLLSNLGFGAVFGFLISQVLGGGVAWGAILLSGAVGNALNAWARAPDHVSIGASTAVFGALGVMVAIALRPVSKTRLSRMKRWSPLVGGLSLLALTGTGGERTDVNAHITGFLAGLVIGWLVARLPIPWLDSRRWQVVVGGLALGLVALSWALAAWHTRS